MRTILIFIASMLAGAFVLNAQNQYQHNVEGVKKVIVEQVSGELVVKSTTEKKLRIESNLETLKKEKPNTDDRAKGLRPLTGGNSDNTGTGLEITRSGENLTIAGAMPSAYSASAWYTLFIPSHISITVDYSSPFAHGDIRIEELSSPIEVKSLSANILFSGITGPALFHTISGNIEGTFRKLNQEAPTSFSTVSGLIDVALPSGSPVNLTTQTISGEVYSGLEIKKEATRKDKRTAGLHMTGIPGGTTRGIINGGGVKLSLQSISGNIYLRSL